MPMNDLAKVPAPECAKTLRLGSGASNLEHDNASGSPILLRRSSSVSKHKIECGSQLVLKSFGIFMSKSSLNL